MDKDKTMTGSNYQRIVDSLVRAASGDLTTEMRLSTANSDFNAIAQAFNNMIRKLKFTMDELRDTNRQVETMMKRLKKIFDGSKDIILHINKYGTIVDINNSVKEILGYEPDDLRGKHFAKTGVISEEEIPKLINRFNVAIKKGVGKDIMKLGFKTKAGKKLCMDASIRLLKTEDEVEGAVIVLRDVTKHIESDTKLHEEKEKLRSIVSSIEDVVFILDKDSHLAEYYKSLSQDEQYVYTNFENYIKKPIKGIFPKSVASEIEKTIQLCMKTGKAQQIVYSLFIHKQALWFNVRIASIWDANKNIVGTTMVIRDITQRIEMEKTLAESEKKYREIFEQSPQGFIILDAEGHIIDVNKKICEWLGYRREDMIGKDHILYPFLTKSGKIVAIKKFIQRLSGKFIPPYELEFIARDGTAFIGEIDARPIRDEKGDIALIVVKVTDVTRRH